MAKTFFLAVPGMFISLGAQAIAQSESNAWQPVSAIHSSASPLSPASLGQAAGPISTSISASSFGFNPLPDSLSDSSSALTTPSSLGSPVSTVMTPSDGKASDNSKIQLGYLPHPYVIAALSAMPGGYAPLAYYVETGFNLESQPGIARFYFGYDDGHKTDDGDQPNPDGHDRYLHGETYARLDRIKLRKWLAGGGYRWSQLSTTKYTKGAGRPFFGMRYDAFRSHSDGSSSWLSARLGLDYFTAGNDWHNGSHGVSFTMIMPRPAERHHVFYNYSCDLFRFHETVTDPANPIQTSRQRAERYFTSYSSFGVLYRFW